MKNQPNAGVFFVNYFIYSVYFDPVLMYNKIYD